MLRHLITLLLSSTLMIAPCVIVGAQQSEFVRGDVDGGGTIDILDIIFTLGYLAVPGSMAPPCFDSADSNDSGVVNVADVVYTLSFMFIATGPPPPPFPACGTDDTPDTLDCDTFPSCP